MAETWIAVAADIRRNRKMTALPSDQARYGWIVALGEAKLLKARGTFTPGQWVEVMGRHARYLGDYIKVGLLHETPSACDCVSDRDDVADGLYLVHDWHVYQREHAARQARYRANRDGGSYVHSDAESDATGDSESDTPSRALSLSYVNSPLSENSDGVLDEVGGSALDAYYRLTVKPPSTNVISWLDRLCDEHPEPRVVEVMVAEWQSSPNPADFLGRVQTRLAVIARGNVKADTRRRADSAAREREEAQRRYENATPEERAKADAAKQQIAEGLANVGRSM